MNLKQLETVALVAEVGSLSRAARSLGIAQSLVSRAIAQIEAEWGDRIFERTGRGVVLSEFGQRIFPHVQLLLAQSARLRDEVKDASGVPFGQVRIGVLPSMAPRLIPTLFENLRATAPGVRLRVAEGFSGQLDEELESGHLDLAVINRYGPGPRQGEDVLAEVATYLICAPGHPLAGAPTVPFRKLDGLPLVLPPAPNGLRSILDQHARQLGVSLDVALEVESLNTMKEVALAGGALTILPILAVDHEVAAGRLSAVEIVEPSLPRTIALGVTRHHPLSRAARLVLARLHELVPEVASHPHG
ncbi:LysR family transcriptional regulator [Cupriavidus sp. 2KB_3]|uniref:LysR family transcriptional regulator n=1 Tax=Cupriavidus TaxID=106589 RepID=UPI0011F06E73|nr:LysR family transcriptional regulator [Cupriavidus campinensis]